MSLYKTNNPKIKISGFTPFLNKKGDKVPGVLAKYSYLYDELYRFKEGYYVVLIEELRALDNKSARDKYKTENLPAFTFSCSFKEGDYRKQSNIQEHTNLLCIDVDYAGAEEYIEHRKKYDRNYGMQTLRDEIYQDIPCVYCGLSCTGTGIFFIVRYEPNEHAQVFNDLEDLFKVKYNIKIDSSCKDFGRLRFATYDPSSRITMWDEVKTYKLRTEYLQKLKKEQEYKRDNKPILLVQPNTDAASAIMDKAVSMVRNARTGERHNKIRAAARLLGGYIGSNFLNEQNAKDQLLQAVFDINYDDMSDAERTIEYGVNGGKMFPIEINVITPDDPQFDFYAEQEETRQREIRALYGEVRDLIRLGKEYAKLDFTELAARYFIDVQRVQLICERLYKTFEKEFNIANKPVIFKVESYLESKYEFRKDIITDTVQAKIKGQNAWRAVRYEDLWREITHIGLKFKFDDIVRLMRSGFVDDVNVWEQFFKAIPYDDDGFDHISFAASHIRCKDFKEQSYFEHMFKKMLVRTMKCALDDNYANRMVFVLASETQSNGKSSFIRWLNPFGAHQYYAENPLEDNKDSRIRLAETFIYNLEELATIGKFEINRLKAVISQIGTRDRKPYGRQAENVVRRCSFFGSTNRTSFLTDDSNTRWLCFEIDNINWSYSDTVNKMQMWGQVYQLYKNGFNCELTTDEAVNRDIKNEQFQVSNVESELISRYFAPSDHRYATAVFLTSTSIHERLLILTKESRISISNVWVGRALTKLGFHKMRHNGTYGYWVNPINHPTYSNFHKDDMTGYMDELNENDDIPF